MTAPETDPTVAAAYKDAARLITALIHDEEAANRTLEALAHNGTPAQLMHLLMAALHTAAEMIRREAAASVMAGEEHAGPALDALTTLWRRAEGMET